MWIVDFYLVHYSRLRICTADDLHKARILVCICVFNKCERWAGRQIIFYIAANALVNGRMAMLIINIDSYVAIQLHTEHHCVSSIDNKTQWKFRGRQMWKENRRRKTPLQWLSYSCKHCSFWRRLCVSAQPHRLQVHAGPCVLQRCQYKHTVG